MKNIILAIFIAFSNLAYSQIELKVPSNGEIFTLEKEEAKKYSISLHTLDTAKKYTIIAKNTQYELGKEYAFSNNTEYKILDSLELTKDKAIEIKVHVKDANDILLNKSEWTIFLKKKDNSYKEQVKTIMDSIDSEEKKSRIVGHFRYLIANNDSIEVEFKEQKKVKVEEKKLKKHFTPDSIELKIRRGSIKDIRIFGTINNKEVVFGRENRSIDIFKINDESQGFKGGFNNKRYLELIYPKEEEDYYIKLSKILVYDYVMGKKFFPKDTIIPIKTDNKSVGKKIPLYKDVYLNSYLEGRLYTDVIGLNGEEANGVAQAEIKAHFNLNTQSNFAFVEPSLHYSKFTKDNDFVVLDSVQSNALTNFHRQSFLNVGLKLNIIKREFGDRYDLEYLNIGSQYSWTRLKEITSTTDITNTVHLFNSFIEIKGKMNEFHNFGISLGNKFLYELPVQDQSLDLDPFSWYIIPELEIFYYPVENKNNTIYLRFTYTSNTRNHDFDYPSLQFGYKFRIKLNQK